MKLEELLKDMPEVLKAVTDAIAKANEGEADKLKHIRFADLSEGGYVSKDKYTSLESDLTGKNEELVKANELIEKLKTSTGKDEDVQRKISEYETELTTLKQENELLKTENALKFALKEAGAEDIDYLVFKAKEKQEIKLDTDGKIKGIDDLVKGLKTQHPSQFANSSGAGGVGGRRIIEQNNLPGSDGDKTVTREQFYKMGYSERLQFKKDNPEQFKNYTQK